MDLKLKSLFADSNKEARKKLYAASFIKPAPVAARTGKMVYIRKEFHRNIQKIIQVIGDSEISLAAYVDNVLAHHFEMFRDEIDELYNRKLKEYGKFEK